MAVIAQIAKTRDSFAKSRLSERLPLVINNYWMSPETTSVNRLPMLNIEHFEQISLDGTWRFQLLHSPTEQLGKRWASIPVPGLWTMQEPSEVFFDKPIYTNTQMPFEEQPPFVPAENPTGIYERDFELPKSWAGKRVVLQVGGYESVALIHINGQEVGLTKDSRLAAEFDVTQYVRSGNNVVRIDVTKWSDATFIEDQDQWWHGGITRSIKLYATNKVFIERFKTVAGLEKDGSTGTLAIEADLGSLDNLSTDGYTLRATITELPKVKAANLSKTIKNFTSPKWTERDADLKKRSDDYFHGKFWDGKIPADAKAAIMENEPWPYGKVILETRIPKVNPWSAEAPHLYTLHIE